MLGSSAKCPSHLLGHLQVSSCQPAFSATATHSPLSFRKLLPDASEEFKKTAFYLSSDGQDAVLNQEQMQQMRREQEEAACTDPQTPLTAPAQQQQTNGSNGLSENNGHLPASGDSMAMVVIRPGTSRSVKTLQDLYYSIFERFYPVHQNDWVKQP